MTNSKLMHNKMLMPLCKTQTGGNLRQPSRIKRHSVIQIKKLKKLATVR